jgi:hypothetical protein
MATITFNGVTLEVTKRQGWTLDVRTALYFDEVNKAMPGGVVIIQGSYNKTVSASAGTHDGPGALDLKPADPARRNTDGYKLLEKICRERGGAAWFRPWANNYHVHIIVIGTQGLPRIAANQINSYLAGRDGLVSNLRISGVINTTFEKWKQSILNIGAAVSDYVKVQLIQKEVGLTADGVWGSWTDGAMWRIKAASQRGATWFNSVSVTDKKLVQKYVGAYQDGIWGPATAACVKNKVVDIQRILGVTADGVWGPVTDKAYLTFRAKVIKVPAPKPAPAPVRIDTGLITVNLSDAIYRSRLKVGSERSNDVARYQAALWNKAAATTREAWAKKWGINRSQVADGVYGKATADLTKIHYNWLVRSQPKGGWTKDATEPGPGLLKYLGFKSIR